MNKAQLAQAIAEKVGLTKKDGEAVVAAFTELVTTTISGGGEGNIAGEHAKNNKRVRGILIESGITPENLPPEEDIKRLGRRVKKDEPLRARTEIWAG